MMDPGGPLLVAAGVVTRGDRLLITKRLDRGRYAGLWEFPGGKVEPGEDPRDTVTRECREECAIDVAVGDIIEVAFHRQRDRDLLILFFHAVHRSGAVVHHGVADHAWVLPAELPHYAFPPADAELLERLQRGRPSFLNRGEVS